MSTTEQEPLIQIIDLRRTYTMGDTQINALSGVDLDIFANEYVAIMGPSGSGLSLHL